MLSSLYKKLEISDGFAFTFLIAAIISEYIFELFVVLPVTKEGIIPLYIHIILGTFIFINVLGNLLATMMKDSSTRKIILPSLLKPEWNFCAACEANSPPRAFHCNKCNACILKRDHHCVFTCCCIGLKNFRYFLIFLFYLAIGSAYASFFNLCFIWDILGGISLYSVLAHSVPFVFWILGYLNFWEFFCTFMSILSVYGALFVGNLFILHFRQMLKNQTTFEKNHGIHSYDLGWKRNIAESLGRNWHIVWIFPLIKSPLPSDGLSFNQNKRPDSLNDCKYYDGNVRKRHGIVMN